MIKKLRENKFFSEKGSVTLFILIAIIFFLIVSLNVYSSNKNKLIAQTEEIKAIEENYNKDLENMDEIYENLVKADLKTVFIKESTINSPNKVEYNLSEWTNENVIAKVTVSSENNPDAQLQVKVTSKKTGNTVTYNKSQVDNNEVIITENSTVVVTFGDKEQRIELTKFDKEIPVLFYDSFYIKNNGKYASGTWTNKETYTTISVKEEISGIPEMYYSTDKQNWIKLDFNQSNGIYQELNKYCGKETWTLKDGRIEDIYFRAKDRAGNYSNISNVYQLRYDLTAPTKPIIENEYNDIWTNKDVEIIAKSSDSLSKISKIEYSYDEVDWQSNWQGILQNNGNEASISGKWDNSFNGKIYVRAIDNAGNISETSYTTVKQDIIPPTVNITPNGNTYYIPAGGKTTLKAKLEALDNESGLHTLEYAWSTSNTVEPINWETFENGKEIVKNDATSGTYYLWTNVIDNVGNKASKIKVSNPFIVSSNNSEAFKIVITSTPTTWTKDNVNITITYGSALTQGKKAGMGISIEEAKNAASENTANQMVVTTNNYYIYAEAIDGNGNKVTATKQITNIDKIAPTVELGTNGGTYTVAQNSNFAQITTSINAQDVNGSGLNTLEYQISSSSTLPLDDDPNWKTFTNGNIITENISGGIWYLYTKVTDNAGNRAINIQKSNPYIANYSVIYDANGGKGAPDSQIKEHNKTITLSTIQPSRTGYTFIGWSTNKSSSTAEYQPGATYTNNASATLYAVWQAKQIEVTFVRNTSSTDNTSVKQTFTYGVTEQKFSDKGWTKTGYTLLGWNKDRDASTAQYSVLSEVSDTWINTNSPKITIYAIWELNSYSLTVNPNGGTWNSTTENSVFTQNYGTTKTIANPTAPTGYKVTFNGNGGSTPSAITSTKSFSGWTNSGSGILSGTTYTFGAGNGTLTANYKNNSITLPSTSRNGYTFLGWYDAASGGNKIGNAGATYTPTGEKTLYAHWTINQYTLTVNPNGGIWNGTTTSSTFTQNYASTKAIANPTAPAGYKVTFNGNGGSTPSAITSTKSFTSWTNSGSGTLSGTTYTFGAGNGTLTANYKNNSITLPTPTRTGYTFTGWYDAASGGNKIGNAGATYTPTGEKTLYAHWTINQYTLTVNPNGGIWNGTTTSSTFTQNYASTKAIANPTAPAGYKVTFNGNGGSTPSAITSTKSFTSWTNSGSGTLSGTTYTFGAGNGTLTANYKNNSITLPTPTRTGYTFTGWYDAASGGNKIGNAGATYTPTGEKTLYAHWTINQYTLTVNPNGGIWNGTTTSSTFTQNYASTKAIANPTAPAGYKVTFNGNGGSTPSAITSTKSFTSWTNSGSGTLSGTTYTFGAGNGTLTANYKNNSITLPTPTRTGYTFTGWYDAASGGNKIGNAGATYTPTGEKTLYAHWTINQYTLTVNPNGGIWNGTTTSSTFTQNYASTKAIANPTAPAGYKVTFNGNGGSTPSAITSTKSFTSWTNSGSGTLSGTTYTFGAGNGTLTANYKNNSITLPTPTRTGYTFTGWYDAASGGNKIGNAGATYTPTGEKTLYAHWTINQYTLTVNPNGGIWNGTTTSSTFTQNYASTKAIANPTAPAGYKVTFNGNGGSTPSAITSTKSFTSWTNSGSGTLSGTTYTFGAGNGTLTANYKNNSITLPTPTRTGYTFTGWYDAASGGNKIGNAGATYTPTGEKTLY
ncbi:MAG: beta strand repeat-containing protein, partial [Clostridia bacterium]